MLIDPDWSTMPSDRVWYLAQSGADGAREELAKRQAREKATPGVVGMVHRIKAGKK